MSEYAAAFECFCASMVVLLGVATGCVVLWASGEMLDNAAWMIRYRIRCHDRWQEFASCGSSVLLLGLFSAACLWYGTHWLLSNH